MHETITYPTAVEPEEWTLVFHRSAANRFCSWVAFGEFKHVSAFAHLAGIHAWVIYDVTFGRTQIVVLPVNEITAQILSAHCRGAELVPMRRRPGGGLGLRLGFWCVPAIKHLLGLRCAAMRPDALYRFCHGSPEVRAATTGPSGRVAEGAG